jgi:hypothetical protein
MKQDDDLKCHQEKGIFDTYTYLFGVNPSETVLNNFQQRFAFSVNSHQATIWINAVGQ